MPDDIVLTQSSFDKLKAELEYLKTTGRAELAEALRKARAYGDLSENFEYHAARRDQGIMNGRIADLEKMLEIAKVVPDNEAAADDGSISLGSGVMVRDLETDDEWEYIIVDAVQADPINDRISVQSPVAKALLGKRAGDTVTVQTPGGPAEYEILAVRRA
jgi:transcription elongation factor GreA